MDASAENVRLHVLGKNARIRNRRLDLLRLIDKHCAAHGRAPTMDQIHEGMGGHRRVPDLQADLATLRGLAALEPEGSPHANEITMKGLALIARDAARGHDGVAGKKDGVRAYPKPAPPRDFAGDPRVIAMLDAMAVRLAHCDYRGRGGDAAREHHLHLIPLVLQVVFAYYNVPLYLVVAQDKRAPVAEARQVAYYLLRREGLGIAILSAVFDRSPKTIEHGIKHTPEVPDRLEAIASLEAPLVRARAQARRSGAPPRAHPVLDALDQSLDDLLYLPAIRAVQEAVRAVILGQTGVPVAVLEGLRVLRGNPEALAAVRDALALGGYQGHESRLLQKMEGLGWARRSA